MLSKWQGFSTVLPKIAPDVKAGLLRQLGKTLVSTDGYVLPFELASVLLVAALIGALMVSWERK
jgi:NADH:ubiquinone oxidoreductase subunit 6 (subunit J)